MENDLYTKFLPWCPFMSCVVHKLFLWRFLENRVSPIIAVLMTHNCYYDLFKTGWQIKRCHVVLANMVQAFVFTMTTTSTCTLVRAFRRVKAVWLGSHSLFQTKTVSKDKSCKLQFPYFLANPYCCTEVNHEVDDFKITEQLEDCKLPFQVIIEISHKFDNIPLSYVSSAKQFWRWYKEVKSNGLASEPLTWAKGIKVAVSSRWTRQSSP